MYLARRLCTATRQLPIASTPRRSATPRIATPSTSSQLSAKRFMAMSSPVPKTMKAIRVAEIGGPEVNKLEEIPVPSPGKGEALLKVLYTGANYIDTYFRSGLYPKPMPYTPGQDAIAKLVSLPTSYAPAAQGATSSGLPPLEVGQTVLVNVGGSGSFAEYMTAPITHIAPWPFGAGEVSAAEGVAAATTAYTALALARESYAVKKGDWVLVRAAAGGVGLILCQLCAHLGAHVIGTVSTPEKAQLARANGAEHVLLTTDGSAENVRKLMEWSGEGVHVVYDGVGKDTFDEDFEVVRRKGTIAMYGNASGPPAAVSPLRLSPKSLKLTRPVLGNIVKTREEFEEYTAWLYELIRSGAFKFTVHKIYPFSAEGVAQTQIDITSRGTVGKLVIKVADENNSTSRI